MKVNYVKFHKHIDGDYSIQFQEVGGGREEYDSIPKTFSFDLYYNPAKTTDQDAALDLLIHSCGLIEEKIDELYKTKSLLEKAYLDFLNKNKELNQ